MYNSYVTPTKTNFFSFFPRVSESLPRDRLTLKIVQVVTIFLALLVTYDFFSPSFSPPVKWTLRFSLLALTLGLVKNQLSQRTEGEDSPLFIDKKDSSLTQNLGNTENEISDPGFVESTLHSDIRELKSPQVKRKLDF